MILHTSDNKYPNSFFFESNETKSLYFYHLCLSVCIHHQNCFLLWVIGFTFSQTWKKTEIHKTFTMWFCMLLEKNYLIKFIFWNFVFTKKIAHHSLCTANVQSTEYIMVWHQIKKSSWLSIFQLNSSKKKGSENHESYVFSEKYKKAMFVFYKKGRQGPNWDSRQIVFLCYFIQGSNFSLLDIEEKGKFLSPSSNRSFV